MYVNLGIGIPTLVANYIPEGVDVTLQSENGMLGMGPFPYEGEEDADLINAGKQTITELPQTAYFDSAQLRDDPRRQDRHGDPRRDGSGRERRPRELDDPRQAGQGHGRRDGPRRRRRRVVVVMDHTSKHGESKVLKACTLPLTGKGVVNRIITNLCVLDVVPGGLKIVELAPGVTMDEVKAKTEATLVS
jgi:3-oxoacid CoA-transferase subunit B